MTASISGSSGAAACAAACSCSASPRRRSPPPPPPPPPPPRPSLGATPPAGPPLRRRFWRRRRSGADIARRRRPAAAPPRRRTRRGCPTRVVDAARRPARRPATPPAAGDAAARCGRHGADAAGDGDDAAGAAAGAGAAAAAGHRRRTSATVAKSRCAALSCCSSFSPSGDSTSSRCSPSGHGTGVRSTHEPVAESSFHHHLSATNDAPTAQSARSTRQSPSRLASRARPLRLQNSRMGGTRAAPTAAAARQAAAVPARQRVPRSLVVHQLLQWRAAGDAAGQSRGWHRGSASALHSATRPSASVATTSSDVESQRRAPAAGCQSAPWSSRAPTRFASFAATLAGRGGGLVRGTRKPRPPRACGELLAPSHLH